MNKAIDIIYSINNLEELYGIKNKIREMQETILVGKLRKILISFGVTTSVLTKVMPEAEEIYERCVKKYESFFENKEEKEDYIYWLALQQLGYKTTEKENLKM